MTDEDKIGSFRSIEKNLGLPAGFLTALLEEGDDWSFVIKAHALVEAAISHMLTAKLREPRAEAVFAWLELSNSKTGKLAFVEALEMLPKPHRRFIRTFSELRNRLVHDVHNVNFTFAGHLANVNSTEKESFMRAFGGIFAEARTAPSSRFEQLANANPRFLVWSSTIVVVALAYTTKLSSERDTRRDQLEQEIARSNAESAEAGRQLLQTIADRVRDHGEFVIRGRKK